jgi:hypothetical protein
MRQPTTSLGEVDRTFLAFGRAMAAWALIERALYTWFEHLTLLDTGVTKPIYFSAKSTSSRLDLLRAAIGAIELGKNEKVFITEAISVVVKYSSFRNKLAHGEFTFDGEIIETKQTSRKAVKEKSISREDLHRASQNFMVLTNLLNNALGFVEGYPESEDESIEICIVQLRELPVHAHSNVSNTTKPQRR